MTAGVLLDAWFDFSRAHTYLQQFGQTDDESTFNGKTACTHADFQRIILAYTGEHVSQDEISHAAGYPWPGENRGMRGLITGNTGHSEAERVIAHWHLPYKTEFGLSFAQVHDKVEPAPAIIGVRYGWWPEWRGVTYDGHKADGRPNGFAFVGGKTQLVGAESIEHAVLYLGGRLVPIGNHGRHARRLYANEPNHGSPSRHERPAFDKVTPAQLERAFDAYSSGNRKSLAIVATKSFRPKGF